MTDYDRDYRILGLQPGASQAEVKQAYRNLAKEWHPDRFAHDPGLKRQAEEKIKEINQAYGRLKDYQPPASGSPPPRQPSSYRSGVSSRVSNAEFYYDQGADNARAGKYKEALDDFSMAIRLNPNYAEAYRYRGFVNSMLGFELGAEADLKKAEILGLEQRVNFTSDTRSSNSGRSPQSTAHPASEKTSTNPRSSSRQNTGGSGNPAAPHSFVAEPSPWTCGQILTGHQDAVIAIALSRDGKTLASASRDQTIQLWNLRNGRSFFTFTGHTAPITSLVMSSDGQLLISGSEDQTVKVWDLRIGNLVRTLKRHTSTVRSIAISPNRQILASAGDDCSVCLWNLATGEIIHILDEHTSPVRSLATSADGLTLFSGSEDQSLKLHHLRTGELLRSLSGHTAKILAIATSPKDHKFATAGNDWQIKLWDDYSIVTGSPINTLSGHRGDVRSITFSPSGQVLASASDDNTLRVWKLQQGTTHTLTGHSAAVNSVLFSPDGQLLISGSADRTIRIWQRSEEHP